MQEHTQAPGLLTCTRTYLQEPWGHWIPRCHRFQLRTDTNVELCPGGNVVR